MQVTTAPAAYIVQHKLAHVKHTQIYSSYLSSSSQHSPLSAVVVYFPLVFPANNKLRSHVKKTAINTALSHTKLFSASSVGSAVIALHTTQLNGYQRGSELKFQLQL